MVKTKKLQKNLGKGLLAGALEKPEVPDTRRGKSGEDIYLYERDA